MSSQDHYSGPAMLRFANGHSEQVDAFLTMLRLYSSDYGEGHFRTSSDVADRALREPFRLTLELANGRVASIRVRERRAEIASALCTFSLFLNEGPQYVDDDHYGVSTYRLAEWTQPH